MFRKPRDRRIPSKQGSALSIESSGQTGLIWAKYECPAASFSIPNDIEISSKKRDAPAFLVDALLGDRAEVNP
jgi:hypothetical protein